MDKLLPILFTALPFIIGAVVIIVLLFLMVKTANGNEALVVSGVGATKDGKPVIKRAGGRIVIPFIQKAKYFDLCVRTAKVEDDVTKTLTGVPVQLNWAVAYHPDSDDPDALARAVTNFLDKGDDELRTIILDVVSGGVRAVIAGMTPEEVMNKKDALDDKIKESIQTQMKSLGFIVVLSIHEVADAPGSTYYEDLAAKDRETRKMEAANITAENNQRIRETAAETGRVAQEKEMAAEVAVAERRRDADVKKAQFKAETDIAQADADRAGEIQQAKIEKTLAEQRGAAEVMKQQQANLAAVEAQKVRVTEAETERKTTVINAEAEAARRVAEAKGEAEATAETTTRKAKAEAEAKRTAAEGEAQAKRTSAAAEADARRAGAEAEAESITKVGEAEAHATEAKGKAEAEAIRAKGLAEAEAARQLSEAQAANDRVNFELEKVRIEAEARVKISTSMAEIMAEVGKNATFYDFSGSQGAKGGSLLSRTLSDLPALMARANLEGQALNGENVNETLGKIAEAILGPLGKGATPDATSTEGDGVTSEPKDVPATPVDGNSDIPDRLNPPYHQ